MYLKESATCSRNSKPIKRFGISRNYPISVGLIPVPDLRKSDLVLRGGVNWNKILTKIVRESEEQIMAESYRLSSTAYGIIKQQKWRVR